MHEHLSDPQSVNMIYGNHVQSIMLVDDDPIFRNMIAQCLQQQGFNVNEAENGLVGLQLLRQDVPDLILCDLNMPIMNGVEFVEEVSWQFPLIPVIVISSTDNMKEVAKVLRFGIKDFFSKPIRHLPHLLSAIETTLQESHNNPTTQRDFTSQWFKLDGNGHVAQEKELYWHLGHLKNNSVIARDLLHALQSERDSQQGGWKLNYQVLQPADLMPLMFDYAWLMDGRLAFYLVDADSGGEDSVGTCLLIRALFNDFLCTNRPVPTRSDLKDLVQVIDQGIAYVKCAAPINALFGIADMVDGHLAILPAGITSTWHVEHKSQRIEKGNQLGDNCVKNFITAQLPMEIGGQLRVSDIGVRSFKLSIKNLTCS